MAVFVVLTENLLPADVFFYFPKKQIKNTLIE